MNGKSETIEGPEAAERFDALVRKVLSVSHEEIMRREAEYRKRSLENPNRRGPKPKAKGIARPRSHRFRGFMPSSWHKIPESISAQLARIANLYEKPRKR
jgi:hypothetical protein